MSVASVYKQRLFSREGQNKGIKIILNDTKNPRITYLGAIYLSNAFLLSRELFVGDTLTIQKIQNEVTHYIAQFVFF